MAVVQRLCLALGAACLGGFNSGCANSGGGGGGGTGPSDPTLAMSAVNKEVGLTGSVLSISVELTGGNSISNETITWTVTGGGGSAPASSQTTSNGVATAAWTLGPEVGIQTLEASYTPPGGGATVTTEARAAGVTNPACAVGVLGTPFSRSWTAAKGAIVFPYGVTIDGASFLSGPLNVTAGVTICLGPSSSFIFINSARLVAQGSAGAPITITAMDITQPWGYIDFSGAPASPSQLNYVRAEYGSGGFFGSGNQHPVIITNSSSTAMVSQGLYLTAPGSSFVNSTVNGSGGAGAELSGPPLGGGTITFSGRVTGAGFAGITVSGPGAVLSNCEVTGNAGLGVQVASGGLPLAIHGCNIFSNGGAEVNSIDFTGTVDATGNWWGAAGGPAAGELAGQVNAGSPLAAPVSLGYLR